MPRLFKNMITAALLLVAGATFAQNDPVLFTVNGTPVAVSEFKYIYSKTNQEKADFSEQSLRDYLDLYTKFKLKVRKARDMQLDTVATLKSELDGYRRTLANSYLIDKEVTDKLVRETYDHTLQDVDISHIIKKLNLLDGICPEAAELLRDQTFSANLGAVLRKMKPTRQVECVELMVSANNITVAYAQALVAATPCNLLVGEIKPKKMTGVSADQMAKMEREMGNLQEQFKLAEQTYGQDILNLVLAKGYLAATAVYTCTAHTPQIVDGKSRFCPPTLIARDEPPRGWFGVAEGFLAAEQSPGARPWHGLGLPSAAWFGEHDLLLDAPCDATLTALVPTRVAVLPKPSFDRLLEQQPGFSRFVLQLQAQRVAALRHRLTWPQRVGTNAGVALRLAELFAAASLFDGDHHVALTQASLSSFVGLSRQRINEALNRLRRCGELELLYGGLRVLDPPRLARRALAGNFDE